MSVIIFYPKLSLRLRHQLLTLFYRVINRPNQIECSFRIIIHFTVHDHIKSADGFFDRYQNTFQSRKGLRHVEGL